MSARQKLRRKARFKPNRYDPNRPDYAAVHTPKYARVLTVNPLVAAFQLGAANPSR